MIYCYRTDSGVLVERDFPMGEAPKTVLTDALVIAHRSFQDEHAPVDADKGQHIPQWPMKSEGMGVNPSQIEEALKNPGAKVHGHEYDKRTGAMVFRDRAHRKACMKDVGYHDLDGGYSDA